MGLVGVMTGTPKEFGNFLRLLDSRVKVLQCHQAVDVQRRAGSSGGRSQELVQALGFG